MGGPRKGFDAAVIDGEVLVGLECRLSCDDVAALVDEYAPAVVAIDSPCACASAGCKARDAELRLNREVCGIRWTPEASKLDGNPYYAWILEGLALYELLAEHDVEVIEVFPTASWTRWHGPREKRSRAEWSREALAGLPLSGMPARTNQDQRDAIAAAASAREFDAGRTDAFGEIVVPKERKRSPS